MIRAPDMAYERSHYGGEIARWEEELSMAPDRQRIQQYLKAFDFRTLFIEELGWDNLKLPGQPQGPTPLRSTALAPTILRRRCPSLFAVVEIPTPDCW